MTKYEQPLIAIDVALFNFDGQSLSVVLGRRQNEPFAGELALPGVLLLTGETLKEAADRALRVKVGQSAVECVHQVGAYDNSDRDPRGPTISVLSYAATNTLEGKECVVDVPAARLPELPFDHSELVEAAKKKLAEDAFTHKDVMTALLTDRFTTAQARRLANELGMDMNQTNITRFLRGLSFVAESDETTIEPGQKGRPSKVWEIV